MEDEDDDEDEDPAPPQKPTPKAKSKANAAGDDDEDEDEDGGGAGAGDKDPAETIKEKAKKALEKLSDMYGRKTETKGEHEHTNPIFLCFLFVHPQCIRICMGVWW